MQRRLGAAGYLPAASIIVGTFCARTEAAVTKFQRERNLPDSGVCDAPTWMALVEASWSLGDRLLYLTSPNLRGDDVAELQTRMSRLGFDCGKVDGIFGPIAADAVASFQANCGLSEDGVFGPQTLRALDRVSRQTGDGPGVAALRDRERIADEAGMAEAPRVAVGVAQDHAHLARLIARGLRKNQVRVITVLTSDAHEHAVAANNFDANVFIGVEAASDLDQACTVAHYEVPNYVSESGRDLANAIAGALSAIGISLEPRVLGYQRPILRETKMPAVLCSIRDEIVIRDHAPAIAEAIAAAILGRFKPSA